MEFSIDNTCVIDCYKYSYREIDSLNIIELRKKWNFDSNRSLLSYNSEIKVHKFLYELNILRNHTKDADLEENINKWLETIYILIGGMLK